MKTISETDIMILADTIYGEARGEYTRPQGGLASLIAVANVVMNRLESSSHYGKTIQEVCKRRFQFSCWSPMDPNRHILESPQRMKDPLWQTCQQVADHVACGQWPDLTQGSNHYYARWIRPPFWAEGLKARVIIGQHLFYQL